MQGETIYQISRYVAEYENGQKVKLYDTVRAVVELLTIDFVYAAISNRTDTDRDEIINGVVSAIMTFYGKELSITGLAHCYEQCLRFEEPFKTTKFAFSIRGIRQLLSIYINNLKMRKQRKEKEEIDRANAENEKPLKFKKYEPTFKRDLFTPKFLSLADYCKANNLNLEKTKKDLETRWLKEYNGDDHFKQLGWKTFLEIKTNRFLATAATFNRNQK